MYILCQRSFGKFNARRLKRDRNFRSNYIDLPTVINIVHDITGFKLSIDQKCFAFVN